MDKLEFMSGGGCVAYAAHQAIEWLEALREQGRFEPEDDIEIVKAINMVERVSGLGAVAWQ